LIEFLIRCLESSDLRLIDGAFITLRNVCTVFFQNIHFLFLISFLCLFHLRVFSILNVETVVQICEDCGRELLSGNIGKPVNALVPRLLQFLRSPHESHRVYALECLNNIVYELPAIIVANMDEFVQVLCFINAFF
jgi:hypothetical protein